MRLPLNSVRRRARGARDAAYRVLYRGAGRLCLLCNRASRRFRPFGKPPRADAMCIYCESLERHRLLWLFLQRSTDLFAGRPRTMLHFAPERSLEPRLRGLIGPGYLTADLYAGGVDLKLDIVRLPQPDETFDVIYCSHVFEHIPDDRAAMRELRRVLKRDGWAILLVPVTVERTVEDPSVTDPAERLRRFGQEDHVRSYGPDYADRLREAGFTVKVITPADIATPEEIVRYGLTPASGEIYYCTR